MRRVAGGLGAAPMPDHEIHDSEDNNEEQNRMHRDPEDHGQSRDEKSHHYVEDHVTPLSPCVTGPLPCDTGVPPLRPAETED